MGGAERPEGGLFSGGQQAEAALLAAEVSPGCAGPPPVPTLLPQGIGQPWQGLFDHLCLLCDSCVCLKSLIKSYHCFSEVCDPWRAPKDCGKSATNTEKAGL